MLTTTTTPLESLRQLIAASMATIDESLAPRQDGSPSYAEGDPDGARVLLRQHTMLTDLQEAAAIGVAELDFAFEGDFDPVEFSLVPEGETAYEKSKALHEIALAGIEPAIAAARAAGIAVHAPELEQDGESAEGQAEGERFGG